MGGVMLGSNMMLMLIMAFVLTSCNVFSGRIDHREQIFYVMGVSLLYRILALLTSIILLGGKANISLLQLIGGPIIDGLVSIIFYKLLIRVLFLSRAFEQSDFYSNRLGLRR